MDISTVVAKFTTRLRANSLVEDLAAADIVAWVDTPQWVNRKLPPPQLRVLIDVKSKDRAAEVYAAFQDAKIVRQKYKR